MASYNNILQYTSTQSGSTATPILNLKTSFTQSQVALSAASGIPQPQGGTIKNIQLKNIQKGAHLKSYHAIKMDSSTTTTAGYGKTKPYMSTQNVKPRESSLNFLNHTYGLPNF